MNDNVKKALLDGKTTIKTDIDILSGNIFDKNDMKIITGYPDMSSGTILASTQSKCFYLKIKPNTTYLLQKKVSNRFNAVTLTSEPTIDATYSNYVAMNESSEIVYTTGNDAVYLLVRYFYNDSDEQSIIDTISVKEQITLNEKNGVVSWDYEDFRHVKDEGFIGQFIARKVNGTIKNISDDFNMTDKEFILKMGVNVYPDYERIYLNEDSDGKYRLTGESYQETRSGKNLYNFKDVGTLDASITTDEDGWITVSFDNTSGTGVKFVNYWTKNLNLKTNTKYNIIMEVKHVNGTGGMRPVSYHSTTQGQFTDAPLVSFKNLSIGDVEQYISTTKESFDSISSGLRTYVQFDKGQSGSITFRLSVLEDISITPETFEYEQYGASPSPDFPSEIVNTLNQGTYQTYLGNDNYIFNLPVDLAGIGDVKNELVIDKENGTFEFTENIGKIVFDGDENWVIANEGFYIQVKDLNFINKSGLLSDKFKNYTNYTNLQQHEYGIGMIYNNIYQLYIRNTNITTVVDFKAWLKENPVTVYYQLATPNVITGTLTKKEYDTTWYTLGNFLVTKVTDDEVNDKTTFEALDYTKRFNQRYDDTITYPCTALDLARNVCEQCGCELGSTSFKNSDFEIKGNVFTNGETCRDVMKQIGKLAFSWVRVDLDNKVYIDFTSNKTVDEYNKIDNSKYYTLKTQKEKIGAVNRVVIGYKDIEGERTKLENTNDIAINGVHEITVFDNPLVYNQELREKVIKQAQDLIGLEYLPMEILTVGHPWLKGDELLEVTDMEGKVHKTIPLDRTIQYFGHIKTKINVGTNTKTNTELAYDSGIGGRLRRTEIIVNKIDGTITEIIEYQDETTKKLNETISSVDETKQTISKVETKVEDITTTTMTSSGGNDLYLDDAMESNVLDYKIDGNSYQEIRSGNNLLPEIVDKTSKTSNGITLTFLNDNKIKLAGTSTATAIFDLSLKETSKMTRDVYVHIRNNSLNSNTAIAFIGNGVQKGWTSFGGINKISNLLGITTDEIEIDTIRFQINSGQTIDITFQPSLEYVSTATEWERYGASPTPDYPSDIEVVKDYNLFDNTILSSVTSGASSISTGNGIKVLYSDQNESSNAIWVAYKLFDVSDLEGETLCVKANWDSSGNNIGRVSIGLCDETGENRKVGVTLSNNGGFVNYKIPILDDTLKYLCIWLYGNYGGTLIKGDFIEYSNIVLSKGTTPKPYIPYKNIGVKTINKNFFTFGEGSITTIGLTTTFNKSEYTINGTTTTLGNVFGEVKFIDVFPPGTYKYSSTLVSGSFQRVEGGAFASYLRRQDNSIVTEYGNSFNHTKTFTLTETTPLYLQMFSNIENKGGVFDNCVVRVQIENNDSFTEYEEHQEKITHVDLRKDNLFNKNNVSNGYIGESGNIISHVDWRVSDYIPIKPNYPYSLGKSISGTAGNKVFHAYYDKNKQLISTLKYSSSDMSVTSPENANYIRLSVYHLASRDDLNTFVLYEGLEMGDNWEVCRKSDVIEEYDITTGILTKRIRKLILNGNESWKQRNNGDGTNTISFDITLDNIMGSGTKFIACDSFKYEQASQSGNEGIGVGATSTANVNDMYIQINRNRLETLDLSGFKKWLSKNPVTVYYILKEPYEVTLKPTSIPLFEGINNVSLLSTLNTNTSIKYLRKTPFSDDYATNQQLNQTNESLTNVDNKTNQNATEISNTNNKLNNDYYNKTQVDSMNTTTENRITQIENTVETSKTATDYQISILQKQLEDGVTILDTKTGYVFDKDGLKISKSDSEMNSQLDHDGLIIKRNDTEVLSVRSDGVVTENLTVRTYFTIGDNTRVENYKNGTGFFYIGGAE